MNDLPASVQADKIYGDYRRGLITRSVAVRRIVAAFDGGVTEDGAAEMLDHSVQPSQRYSPIGKSLDLFWSQFE